MYWGKVKSRRTCTMGRLGYSGNQLVQENDLSLVIIHMRLHVHIDDIRVVPIIVRQRSVMSLDDERSPTCQISTYSEESQR
jgi:hypothetical protein